MATDDRPAEKPYNTRDRNYRASQHIGIGAREWYLEVAERREKGDDENERGDRGRDRDYDRDRDRNRDRGYDRYDNYVYDGGNDRGRDRERNWGDRDRGDRDGGHRQDGGYNDGDRHRDRDRRRDDRGERRSRSRSRRGHRDSGGGKGSAKGGRSEGRRSRERGQADPSMPPPPSDSGPPLPEKRRKSRFDPDDELPTWVADIVTEGDPAQNPPVAADAQDFRTLSLDAYQIRALIGKGGDRIKGIRNQTGSDIMIRSQPGQDNGLVTIVGNAAEAERVIRQTLIERNCPLGQPKGVKGLLAHHPSPWDVQIEPELVSAFIGPGGSSVRQIKEDAGGAVISVMPATEPGGPQHIRIGGDNAEIARKLVLKKIDELKAQGTGGAKFALPSKALPVGPVVRDKTEKKIVLNPIIKPNSNPVVQPKQPFTGVHKFR